MRSYLLNSHEFAIYFICWVLAASATLAVVAASCRDRGNLNQHCIYIYRILLKEI
jgi:hypothetical protein